jgi:hypothetical protein
MSSAAPPAAPPPPPPPRGESPAEVVLAQPELRSLIVARLIACCSPAELARAEGACKGLHEALTPHWRAACAALSPGVVNLRAQLINSHTSAPAVTRWRRLHNQLVSAAAATACVRAKTWSCKDVMFSAEVRHRGALVFMCTFGPLKPHEHGAGDDTHILENRAAGKKVRFSASGDGGGVERRPRLTVGDLMSARDFTLELHGVNLKRGSAVARLCTGVAATLGDFEDPGTHQKMTQASLAFGAQLPSVCRDSLGDGRALLRVQLHLWFQARDDVDDASSGSSDSDEELHAAEEGDEEEEEEELAVWYFRQRPADSAEGQRERARRVVVRPRNHAYVMKAPAMLSFTDEEEKCTCGQLCAALDMLHWV